MLIARIDKDNIDSKLLEEPAKIIREGGTVAFPTETVYGLGANALMPDAVDDIFKAKGRPNDNPLIVHIADISQVDTRNEKQMIPIVAAMAKMENGKDPDMNDICAGWELFVKYRQ